MEQCRGTKEGGTTDYACVLIYLISRVVLIVMFICEFQTRPGNQAKIIWGMYPYQAHIHPEYMTLLKECVHRGQ